MPYYFWICKRCGEGCDEFLHQRCPACGADREGNMTFDRERPNGPRQETWPCPLCGARIDVADDVCYICGSDCHGITEGLRSKPPGHGQIAFEGAVPPWVGRVKRHVAKRRTGIEREVLPPGIDLSTVRVKRLR